MENGLMTELHSSIYDIAPSVARTVARKYSKWVDKDDVKQECLLWAINRSEWINSQLSEPDTEKRRHNEQKLAWQMTRAAERYCRKEKAAKSGYQIADEAYYESATLAQLLPFVIASVIDGTVLEQAQEMIKDGQPRGSSSPAEGGNLLATLMDIKGAYLKLNAEDQRLLVLRYHENLTLAQMGSVLECHATTADRRCDHALRELNNLLGGRSPYQ
jgi:DNA-directed RNA polymerase specialized sigma24 family protein